MIKKFYSIFDTTAQLFLNPLEAKNDGDAVRLFTTFVNGNKQESNIARYPQHFILFHVYDMDDQTGMTGTFNLQTQKLEKQSSPKELIIGLSCVEEPTYTMKDAISKLREELKNQNVVDINTTEKAL